MKKLFCILSMAAMLFFCQGCCSIFCGSEKSVKITSTPDNAKFSIKDRTGAVIHSGTTPSTVTLKRGDGYFRDGGYTVIAEKENYGAATVQVKQGLETGWYCGNILFGGLIGMLIVDPLTGAMYNIDDAHIDIIAGAGPPPQTIVDPKTGQKKTFRGYRATQRPNDGGFDTVPVYE